MGHGGFIQQAFLLKSLSELDLYIDLLPNVGLSLILMSLAYSTRGMFVYPSRSSH